MSVLLIDPPLSRPCQDRFINILGAILELDRVIEDRASRQQAVELTCAFC